jgi:hypothetical protein
MALMMQERNSRTTGLSLMQSSLRTLEVKLWS